MNTSDTLLFDHRFPIWFRVPALAFGLFTLWLALATAADGLFGVKLGLPLSNLRGSPLLGSLGCFAIAAVWIFVWFARLRILFDAARQELIVWTKGCFRSHERRISLAGGNEIHFRQVRSGFASRKWEVSVEFTDGRSEHVTDIPSGIMSFAESLEATTKLPVRRSDDKR